MNVEITQTLLIVVTAPTCFVVVVIACVLIVILVCNKIKKDKGEKEGDGIRIPSDFQDVESYGVARNDNANA